MKIRLVDKTIYSVNRAEIVDGRLEIDFADKTAEEVQAIFQVPANLAAIDLLTDADDQFGQLAGWSVYGGVTLVGDTKTAILTKAPNVTEERITAAEADALAAKTAAAEQAQDIAKLQEQVAEGGTGVDQELFAATAVVARANAQALTDEQALEAKVLYPEWDPASAAYAEGFKVLYDGILYKCISAHTSQADWAPGVAPSLWTAIENGEHAGTKEDPIPVPDTVTTAGMEYEKGKYYVENSMVYVMDRQGMEEGGKVTLYFAPSALVGQYFSVAEG